jgi:hypothetical protein
MRSLKNMFSSLAFHEKSDTASQAGRHKLAPLSFFSSFPRAVAVNTAKIPGLIIKKFSDTAARDVGLYC